MPPTPISPASPASPRPTFISVPPPVSPRTPDERNGELDYFSRAVSVPMITLNPAVLSPNTLERVAPLAQRREDTQAPVIVPRFFGRRIPLPIRVSYVLAGMAAVGLISAMSTLGIAIANRIARERAGHPA